MGGESYVTWRDFVKKFEGLDEKVDEVKEEIGGEGGIRERLARIETWLRLGPIILAAAIAFGPEVAERAAAALP